METTFYKIFSSWPMKLVIKGITNCFKKILTIIESLIFDDISMVMVNVVLLKEVSNEQR